MAGRSATREKTTVVIIYDVWWSFAKRWFTGEVRERIGECLGVVAEFDCALFGGR